MDPNANLIEQLRLVKRLEREANGGVIDHDDVARLCELVTGLNYWLERGGALPDPWRPENQDGLR